MKDILMDLAAAVFTQVQTVTEEAIGVECPLCKPLFNFHENLAGLSFKNSCQITEGIDPLSLRSFAPGRSSLS